jgi:hypothetical protein
MKWVGHVVLTGDRRVAYRILVGKRVKKTPWGRSRRRWDDSIRMDLEEIC